MSNTNIETGGPAFPGLNAEFTGISSDGQERYEIQPSGGMTMRDYFAAKALPIMWDAYDKGYCGLNNKDEPNTKIIADGAYQMADAMLRAREAA